MYVCIYKISLVRKGRFNQVELFWTQLKLKLNYWVNMKCFTVVWWCSKQLNKIKLVLKSHSVYAICFLVQKKLDYFELFEMVQTSRTTTNFRKNYTHYIWLIWNGCLLSGVWGLVLGFRSYICPVERAWMGTKICRHAKWFRQIHL